MNREDIYSALFAKVSSSANFATIGRLLKHWTDVGPEEMPALYQVQKREEVTQLKGQGKRWTFKVDLYVYVHTNSQQLGGEGIAPPLPDATLTPSMLMNPLIDAIEAALAIDDFSNNACTLGGLVSRAWIDGVIETSEGALGDHEVAIIPISIMVGTT